LEALGVAADSAVYKSRDYFVVLPNEAVVRSVSPDISALKKMDGLGVIITAPGDYADAASRCFYPKAGIDEDPVTGSAHCNIVPYWANALGKKDIVCQQVSARGGELRCSLKGDRVILGGQAVLVMKGEIIL
jgi:predicted PhzF superfamily epimerase YddE/YHI9